MLLSLLPGLRDLRTPLAVGYLWLVFAWLVWGPLIPPRSSAHGVIARGYEFVDIFGSTAGIAILTFLAFLVGSLLSLHQVHLRLVMLLAARRRLGAAPITSLLATRATTIEVTSRLYEIWVEQAKSRGYEDLENNTEVLSDNDYLIALLRALSSESTEFAIKLRIHPSVALYESYDRRISESEFRFGVALPLACISVTLAVIQGLPLMTLGLLVPAVLLWQGNSRMREARSELYQLVLAGEIKSQVIERAADIFDSMSRDHATRSTAKS